MARGPLLHGDIRPAPSCVCWPCCAPCLQRAEQRWGSRWPQPGGAGVRGSPPGQLPPALPRVTTRGQALWHRSRPGPGRDLRGDLERVPAGAGDRLCLRPQRSSVREVKPLALEKSFFFSSFSAIEVQLSCAVCPCISCLGLHHPPGSSARFGCQQALRRVPAHSRCPGSPSASPSAFPSLPFPSCTQPCGGTDTP